MSKATTRARHCCDHVTEVQMRGARLSQVGGLSLGAVLVSACLAGQELVNDVQNATLTVSVSGTGNGTVTAVSSKSDYSTVFGRISCRKAAGTCTASTDLDEHGTTTITLTAAADSDSRFVSWEKCSATTADPLKATVELDAETGFECGATFDALPPTCDNPYVLDSDFEDDSVWELQLGGGQVAGSYPSFGGNPGAYRREEPARPANGFVSYTRYALRTEVYDPAVQGAIAGILYSEDRICLLYTSDAADERSSVDLGGRRII